MFNLYGKILSNPRYFRQLKCGESLISIFNCPLENKYEDAWSHYNYIVYVIDGRKVWHTAHGSYDLRKGNCVFIRKGACIVEQFLDTEFCLIMFFIPDEFITEVLKSKSAPLAGHRKKFDPVIPIDNNAAVHGFFQSMVPHFDALYEPDQSLLQLKFKELILTLAGNHDNAELIAYFWSMLQQPQSISLQNVMEENYCYNLSLEDFAKLSARSLSAFKRDFLRIYHTTPGKWLMDKRLNYAKHLLTHLGKTVGDAAFESGFESNSHFSRAFRQRFGVTPVSLRAEFA